MQSVLAPLLALVAALVLTPYVRRLAFRVRALDAPDYRKVHQEVMPRLGGLAIYASFVLATVVGHWPLPLDIEGLLAGATLITAVGVLDDVFGLRAWTKLAGQVVAAVVFYAIWFYSLMTPVTVMSNPFGSGMVHVGYVGIAVVTVVWLVAVTNAVNLIDGLDGLASGTAIIAALTMAAVIMLAWRRGAVPPDSLTVVGLALIMAAAALGFWKYNFHPARIFLGDSGSMLLGFLLGAMAVMGLAKSATTVSVIIPLVILGIPLADTVLAVARRCWRHRSILQPDREHLHHRLLDLGLNHRQAVLAIYGVDVVLGGSAVVLTVMGQTQALILAAGLVVVGIVVANRLDVIVQLLRTNYLAKDMRRSRRM